ncbi:MAG: tetratricopeptide repeat protein [Dysgonamonadaceae bacterium]|jgi:hypothetical protein|nr:tetratricopeptide repeat protein [Dysgonamonadaceae bacterium]
MKTKLIILLVLFGCSTYSFAQKAVRNNLRSGNKEYRQEKYTESEIAYRKALEGNVKSSEAAYNLGNSLFMQQKYPEAEEQYQAAIEYETDKVKKSWSWHNTGNIFLQQAVEKKENPDQTYDENLKKSIEAYKNALRNNPKDDETRYNLALAQKLLKDNEGNGGGGGNDQQQQDQQQDQKQDQKQDQQDQKQDQQDQKQDQQQQPQMSQENAQQILDAMMQNEKNTQEKVKEQQMKVQQRKRTEKEW